MHDRLELNAPWEMNGDEAHGDLPRTDSDTFTLCEGDADEVPGGLFHQVVDAMNTAKDIAYVIWNVGWR